MGIKLGVNAGPQRLRICLMNCYRRPGFLLQSSGAAVVVMMPVSDEYQGYIGWLYIIPLHGSQYFSIVAGHTGIHNDSTFTAYYKSVNKRGMIL